MTQRWRPASRAIAVLSRWQEPLCFSDSQPFADDVCKCGLVGENAVLKIRSSWIARAQQHQDNVRIAGEAAMLHCAAQLKLVFRCNIRSLDAE